MDLHTHLAKFGKSPIRIKVKIIPASPKNEIIGTMADGAIKIRIHAAPEQGKANKELIHFLAQELKINSSDIEIISGHTASRKELFIDISSKISH